MAKAELVSKKWLPAQASEQIGREGFCVQNLPGLSESDLLSIGCDLARLGVNLVPGKVVDLKQILGTPYRTLSRSGIPFHNDGLYRPLPPRFLMLYCVTPASRGGQTILTRGDKALLRLSSETRRTIENKMFEFSMAGLKATRRMLQLHPTDGSPVLFFVDPKIARNLRIVCEEEDDFSLEHLLATIRMSFTMPDVVSYRHDWRTNDLLIIDNYRVLHARTAYLGERLLKRLEIGPTA